MAGGCTPADVWKREGDLFWIRCPKCSRTMGNHPISRFGTPQYVKHQVGQCNADMIVIPCAATQSHRVEIVPGKKLVPRLQEYIRDRRVSLHQHLAAVYVMTGDDD